MRSDHPVGCAVHDRIAERFKSRDRDGRRRRPERGAKSLVGALMRVHRGDDRRIERIGRIEFDPPVVAQRRIERDGRAAISTASRSSQASETRSSSAEVVIRSTGPSSAASRSRLRSSGTAVTVTPAGCVIADARASRLRSLSTSRQFCRAGKTRRERAQRRAGAAGEIDDPDRGAAFERSDNGVEHRRIARARIVRLAQREPVGRKAAHASASSARANIFAESCQVGSCRAAARAAMRQMAPLVRIFDQPAQRARERARIVRRNQTPAPAGTVSGIAPAVVPITGRPWAIASA